MNYTNQFIERIYDVSTGDTHPSLIHQAKRCLMDYMGVTLAGSTLLKKKDTDYIDLLKDEIGNSPVIGLNRRGTMATAALINGINSHAIELDDGHRGGMVHTGAPVFSGLIPIAERFRINGDRFLRGVIAGYEATVRLAEVLQPYHKEKGYHTTGTCGVIGAVVAIAVAMQYDHDRIKNCISAGIAGSSGFLKMQEDESDLKNYNVGNASAGAVNAAMIAHAGFCGPSDPLGGNRGFISLMGDRQRPSFSYDDSSSCEAIRQIYVKTHASCRHCHSPIDGTLAIMNTCPINIEDIDRITIRTYKNAIPGHDHTKIESMNSAKLSMPYAIAMAIMYGEVGIDVFSQERLNDPKIEKMMNSIEIEEDLEYTNLSPDIRAAEVMVRMKNGEQYVQRVNHAKGEPENPLSDSEIEEKFFRLATYSGKTGEEIESMMGMIWSIEDRMEEFYNML